MNRHYLHISVKSKTKVGVLHENARISRRIWRKLISLISIWANYTVNHHTRERLSTNIFDIMKLKILFHLNCDSPKYIAKLISLSIFTCPGTSIKKVHTLLCFKLDLLF